MGRAGKSWTRWVGRVGVVVCLGLLLTWAIVAMRGDGCLEAGASIAVGDRIPAFSLRAAGGETVTRDDLLGKGPVVLYFYPRDATTGCTIEACAFRDSYEVFTEAGAEVVGVSADTVESHEAFAADHELPFVLLSDPDNRLRCAFGVPRTLGVITGRVTYVADRDGVVRHTFDSQLQFSEHVSEALETVQALAAQPR